MTDFETADVDQLRQHVKRNEEFLRTHPDRDRARAAAISVAEAVAGPGSDVARKARELPTARLVPPRAVSTPTARDPEFDAAVEALIPMFYEALDGLKEWQQQLAVNGQLGDEATVALVLAEANKTDQVQWSGPLAATLAIPNRQALDALEDLSHEGAIKIVNRVATGDGSESWLFQVTSQGRKLARGTAKPHQAFVPIQLTQHISNSTIASAGFAAGPVEQHITINPEVRDIVDALAQFHVATSDDAETVAASALAERAAQELQTNGWSLKATSLLKAIPATVSGITAFSANVKPAYELIHALAAAHGVNLPPLP